jgi:hypothetical protein
MTSEVSLCEAEIVVKTAAFLRVALEDVKVGGKSRHGYPMDPPMASV